MLRLYIILTFHKTLIIIFHCSSCHVIFQLGHFDRDLVLKFMACLKLYLYTL